mgnify:CR=1 FL=1
MKDKIDRIMENIQEDLISNQCPICNNKIENNICSICDINLVDIFICPLTKQDTIIDNENKICAITNEKCEFPNGLDYETCPIYHKFGM